MKSAKIKKTILSLAAVTMLTVGYGKLVLAQTNLSYAYYLPATGSVSSSIAVDKATYGHLMNDVSSVGNSYEYQWWGTLGVNGGQVTSKAVCSGTGLKYAYFVNLADANSYYGSGIAMKIKTGAFNFTETYISGKFTP